jgi:hypothetical protein
MKPSDLVLVTVICICTPLFAQQEPTPVNTSSTVPASARYEIVQSTLAARWTNKLDRQTGIICQIVTTKDNENVWERMDVDGLPPAAGNGVHYYQLFISGLAAKWMFLMNVDTGATWQLQHYIDPTTKAESFVWAHIH